MSNSVNNEGRLTLTLPSGKKAVLRPYDAYCADAIGDAALNDEGTAHDKVICGLVEAIDGESLPNFDNEDSRGKAIAAARNLFLNDYHYIIFMAVASFRDGVFNGKIPDPIDGGTFYSMIPLLDEDGNPLDQFQPPEYPRNDEGVTENKIEWEEEVPELDNKVVKFRFRRLTGHSRAAMLDEGVNMNSDLVHRHPAWEDPDTGTWRKYQPKGRPPVWVSRIVSRKAKVEDPTIQFTAEVRNARGRKINLSLFGVPDFFLRDFT